MGAWPPLPCPGCGRWLRLVDGACVDCWRRIDAATGPGPGPWLVAVGPYRGELGRLLRAAKYRPCRALLDALGRRLGARVRCGWPDAAGWTVTPVPADDRRRRRRGEDHAARLAAAVAAGMVPLAVGTQTGGSVIRPAAFCGVVGFKPGFGMIPRRGVLLQSPSLDTVGVFARDIEGAALLCDVLFGHDAGDPASLVMAPPRVLSIAASQPPVRPMLAMVAPPGMDEHAADDTKLALEELVGVLGDGAFGAPLPNAFDEAAAIRERINFAEMAKSYYGFEKRGRDMLSDEMRAALDAGRRTLARDYLAALDWPDVLYAGLEEIFERCDAIVTPATPGPAPEGLESTGDAIFNGLWTMLGTPAVTIPVFQAANGLPMGLQLVGRRGDDARLLRTARWLMHTLTQSPPATESDR